ncbi:MAG: hypothetical protein CMA16_06390 [Euryarchaeota archaeon]|nr:hypothetical protein [Euryarchaeota archaeon]|tara:strand:- start:627 stop:1766 length:1140 start_codon:yes stop_codon:yes gene_type:complete
MKRTAALLLIALLPLASAATSVHIEWDIGQPIDAERRYIEHFPSSTVTCPDCMATTDDDIVVQWWRYSDQTGSTWPDDDANLRAGNMGVELNESRSILNGNNSEQRQHLIDVEGTLSIRSDLEEQYYLFADLTVAPLVNLRNDVIMQFLFVDENSEDNHGRELSYLVRDLSSEVGFYRTAGNVSNVNVTVSYEHLFAAGVDLSEERYGWKVLIVVMGAEADSVNPPGAIAVYETSVPTSSENVGLLDYLPPLAFLAVALVIIFTVVRSSFNQEHGLPEIRARWKDGNDPAIVIEVDAKRRDVAIQGCEAAEPWSMRGGVKRSTIDSGSSLNFDVRFKKWHHEPLVLRLKMEVDTLGGWTQNIRLPLRNKSERSVEDEHD